jgi:anti-sigma regulatory factor (Ser/Thr protein kinase)
MSSNDALWAERMSRGLRECCSSAPDSYDFSGTLRDPSHARQFVRDRVCLKHGLLARGALALATSELVTNAVLYGAPPITVDIGCHVSKVWLSVRDLGEGLASLSPRTPSQGLGLGLKIVDQVSEEWGSLTLEHGSVVWCLIGTGVMQGLSERPDL